MKLHPYLIFCVLIPIGAIIHNLIIGGTPFYGMTNLAYFLYFAVPAVGVIGYYVAQLETEEEREKKHNKHP